jgi:hypothetical protein
MPLEEVAVLQIPCEGELSTWKQKQFPLLHPDPPTFPTVQINGSLQTMLTVWVAVSVASTVLVDVNVISVVVVIAVSVVSTVTIGGVIVALLLTIGVTVDVE